MSKQFKTCVIFFISTAWLVLTRIVFSFLNLSDNVTSWLFSFLVQVIGMGVIPLVLYKCWIKEDILTGFSVKTKIPPVVYILAIVLGFLLNYMTRGISLLWQNILSMLGYVHVNGAGTIYSNAGVLVMEILTTAMMPAIFEELTDRGLTMQMFKGIEDDRVTMVLMAALFALAHQNIMQTGYTFVGGLVFAFLALKTRSIIPGMIIHFINNLFSVLSGYSAQHGGFIAKFEDKMYDFFFDYLFLAILTWILAGMLIVMILKYIANLCKEKNKEPEPDDGVYFYPNKMRYVDDLFGSGKRELTGTARPSWTQYAFLYGAVALNVLLTVFSFIWGVWR